MLSTGKIALVIAGLSLATSAGWIGATGRAEGKGGVAVPPAISTALSEQDGNLELGQVTLAEILSATKSQPEPGSERAKNQDSQPRIDISSLMSRQMPPSHIPVRSLLSEQEKRIEHLLQQPSTANFPGLPLNDVLQHLSQAHQLTILLDGPTASQVGVTGDEEVSLIVKNAEPSLNSILNLVLRDVGGVELDYLIKDDVLLITSSEAAEEYLESRVYDVRLFGLKDITPLLNLVQTQTSVPWFKSEGIGGHIDHFNGALIVRQTQRGHREIEGLLNLLAEDHLAHSKPPAKQPE